MGTKIPTYRHQHVAFLICIYLNHLLSEVEFTISLGHLIRYLFDLMQVFFYIAIHVSHFLSLALVYLAVG